MTIATDRRQQFETEGYLVIEEAIAGSELTRLQEAFDAAARAGKADWLAGIAAGRTPPGFYDLPDPLSRDDVFIDLA